MWEWFQDDSSTLNLLYTLFLFLLHKFHHRSSGIRYWSLGTSVLMSCHFGGYALPSPVCWAFSGATKSDFYNFFLFCNFPLQTGKDEVLTMDQGGRHNRGPGHPHDFFVRKGAICTHIPCTPLLGSTNSEGGGRLIDRRKHLCLIA